MRIPNEPIEHILNVAGVDPQQTLKTGCSAFGYLEACIMAALDEIEEDEAPSNEAEE